MIFRKYTALFDTFNNLLLTSQCTLTILYITDLLERTYVADGSLLVGWRTMNAEYLGGFGSTKRKDCCTTRLTADDCTLFAKKHSSDNT